MKQVVSFVPYGESPDDDSVDLVAALHHSAILKQLLKMLDLDPALLEMAPREAISLVELSFLIRFSLSYEVSRCGKRVRGKGKCVLPKGHGFECLGDKIFEE